MRGRIARAAAFARRMLRGLPPIEAAPRHSEIEADELPVLDYPIVDFAVKDIPAGASEREANAILEAWLGEDAP